MHIDCIEACTKKAGSGGSSITIDTELNEESTNPVQNSAIYSALGNKADSDDLPLIVTAELNTGTGEIENATATLAQVVTAAESGKSVLLCVTIDVGNAIVEKTFYLSYIGNDGTNTSAEFIGTSVGDSETSLMIVSAVSNQNDGAWAAREFVLLPAYSSATAGKVLSVNNDGELEWITPQ